MKLQLPTDYRSRVHPREVSQVPDAGAELSQGLAADREARAQRVRRVRRGLERAGRLERWGGRLLGLGGICFYGLFMLFPLAGFVFRADVPPLTWKLAFGLDIGAIAGGGLLVFLAKRIAAGIERWAQAHSIEV